MLKDKLLEQLNNENHYRISKYVLVFAKEMKLDTNALILLIYFLNQKNKDIFDYKRIITDLSFNERELLESISILKEKKLVAIEMEKNESGILEEKVNFSSFYEIAFSKMLDEENKTVEENDLFNTFEKEFGRTLSPMEYDIINSWLEQKIDKELIIEALKETVFNGVNNLRYVDKILYEWGKKGIKKSEDINNKMIKDEEDKQEEYYEYDWLNE